ncbi:hypothetical protein E1J17_09390 [Kocuria rosea]|nr:hypothetical protein [Kocuria rosea]THE17822.1 hypothetical protein E1J17_09390 [Kocuria rosea]
MESRELLGLVKSALEAVESPEIKPSGLVRQAIRIATAHRDYDRVIRFALEINGVEAGQMPSNNVVKRAYDSLDALIGAEATSAAFSEIFKEWTDGRALSDEGPNKGKIVGFSITRVEENVDLLEGMHEKMSREGGGGSSYEGILTSLLEQRAVLNRVRRACFDYFLQIEDDLEQGHEESSVLQRGKEYVDATLTKESPGTLRRIKAAERRLGNPDSGIEDFSLALTCCRRTLHSLADFVYPATGLEITGRDGKKRKMTANAFLNRILQFVDDELGKHKQGEVVQQSLDDLGKRLGGLNNLSSKGVHDDVSRDEAETCLMLTYIAVADVLRIWDGTRSTDRPTPGEALETPRTVAE